MNTITVMDVAAGGAKVAQRITGHPNPSPWFPPKDTAARFNGKWPAVSG